MTVDDRRAAGGVGLVEEVAELDGVAVGDAAGGDVRAGRLDRRRADVEAAHPEVRQRARRRRLIAVASPVPSSTTPSRLPAELRAVLLEQHADREAVVRRLVGGGEAAHAPTATPARGRATPASPDRVRGTAGASAARVGGDGQQLAGVRLAGVAVGEPGEHAGELAHPVLALDGADVGGGDARRRCRATCRPRGGCRRTRRPAPGG